MRGALLVIGMLGFVMVHEGVYEGDGVLATVLFVRISFRRSRGTPRAVRRPVDDGTARSLLWARS
jgi:hypothetical protein